MAIDTCLNISLKLDVRKKAALALNNWYLLKNLEKVKTNKQKRAKNLKRDTPVRFWSNVDDLRLRFQHRKVVSNYVSQQRRVSSSVVFSKMSHC